MLSEFSLSKISFCVFFVNLDVQQISLRYIETSCVKDWGIVPLRSEF